MRESLTRIPSKRFSLTALEDTPYNKARCFVFKSRRQTGFLTIPAFDRSHERPLNAVGQTG
jgi:hypothetical protein